MGSQSAEEMSTRAMNYSETVNPVWERCRIEGGTTGAGCWESHKLGLFEKGRDSIDIRLRMKER